VALDFGIAFRRDADTTPFGVLVRLGRQRHQGGRSMVSKNSRRLAASLRIRRPLNSSTGRTAASTLAKSRGLRGRVGKSVVP
jgi:hypothetical protein